MKCELQEGLQGAGESDADTESETEQHAGDIVLGREVAESDKDLIQEMEMDRLLWARYPSQECEIIQVQGTLALAYSSSAKWFSIDAQGTSVHPSARTSKACHAGFYHQAA